MGDFIAVCASYIIPSSCHVYSRLIDRGLGLVGMRHLMGKDVHFGNSLKLSFFKKEKTKQFWNLITAKIWSCIY